MLHHIFEFNYSALPEKYSKIITFLGVSSNTIMKQQTDDGAQAITDFLMKQNFAGGLSQKGVSKDTIVEMAYDSMINNRCLLANNVREVTLTNVIYLYLRTLIN